MTESNKKLTELENLRAAFSGITGQELQGESLRGLKDSLDKFIQKGGVGDLSQDRAKFFLSLQKTLMGAIRREDRGVVTKEEVKEAQLIKIDQTSLTELSEKLSKIIGDSLGKSLNIGPEIASILEKNLTVDELKTEISNLSVKNSENSESNTKLQKDLNNALLNSLKEADFTGSSKSLERAATALENAVEKITITPAGAAAGFVPSFSSSTEAVSRAVKTERALGGKPVIDYNKQIGTYVRDGNTQPNFAAVKRDHPEGLKKASKNSKFLQGVSSARGFIPNFFNPLAKSQEDYINEAYFGKESFVDKSNLASVKDKFHPLRFGDSFLKKAGELNLFDYTRWEPNHQNIIGQIINKNKDDLSSLLFSRFDEFKDSIYFSQAKGSDFLPFGLAGLGIEEVIQKVTGSDSIGRWLSTFNEMFNSGHFSEKLGSTNFIDSKAKAYDVISDYYTASDFKLKKCC